VSLIVRFIRSTCALVHGMIGPDQAMFDSTPPAASAAQILKPQDWPEILTLEAHRRLAREVGCLEEALLEHAHRGLVEVLHHRCAKSDPEVVVDAIARERLSIADTARRFGLPEGDVSESSTRRPATL
jgi:hypothetical protein